MRCPLTNSIMPALTRLPSLPLLTVLCAALASAQAPRPLPPLEQATWIVETATAATRSWEELLDRLARADAVFLGETHVDDTTHRAELAVLEGLLARRQGKVVLSLEMFERDVQPALDDWLLGRIDEPAFLERSRPWGNYATDYRPLVLAAKAAGVPVIAANFPTTVRRRLGMGGKQAFDALPPEIRALLPETIHPASDAYWARVDRATRGHMGAVLDKPPAERLYETQNLWDNAMGDNVAKARAAHPDRVVLHIAGGFHVAYRDGTVAQFELRLPDADAVVASIVPVPDLHAARPDRDRAQADWLIYGKTLARSEFEGTWAVEVPAELRYRLSVPASPTPLPLLVWLPDRHTRPDDAIGFWTAALGDEAAVAVVEQPFPELQDDLAPGGRFVFGDGFRADYGRAQHGLERLVEYVTRRQPVDGQRVLIAGAGDGGAAVLWTAMYGPWLGLDFLAVDPGDLTRLGLEALPDLPPVARTVQLAARAVAKERLDRFAADFAKVGAKAEVVTLANEGAALAEHVRKALGLPPRTAAGEPLWLVLERDLPHARAWAELYAQRLLADGKAARIVTAGDLPADAPAANVRRLGIGAGGQWPLHSLADGARLPLAGGPFGGTTIVVLPAGTSDADREVWLQMEKDRVLRRRSMFSNLAVARMDGEPSLAQVLESLQKRGRSRVLVVPATFCADPATMQALRQQAGSAAAAMDLAWLPGLGGELVR
jgi:uncharacterized iron-regulated protein